MRITVERAAFLKSLAHVQSVVERRNTIPILANILLVAERGAVTLTATDLDIEIIDSVAADVAKGGATTVSAHTLYEIIRKIPEGAQVQLEYKDGDARISLSAGRSRFQLACLPRDDFPAMSAGTLSHHFALPAKDLSQLIDKTRFAVSTEETRYYLNGIYLHSHTENSSAMLRAVATDGHRLARYEQPAPHGGTEFKGVIVPRKAVNEVRRLLEDATGTVEVALSESKIRFVFGPTTLTSTLIDGTFPDYQRVIPVGNNKHMSVDRKEMALAVDRVSTVSSERSRAIRLQVAQDKLTLTVVSPDAGTATEELPADYRGEPLEIGFNARYLLEILERMDNAQADFFFADSGSPTMLRDGKSESTVFVLMPMRV